MGGENSKLAFRKCIFRLAEQRALPPNAEDVWSPIWLLPDGPHDVFSLVTPADIRRIRDNAKENFITLFDKLFDRLLTLKNVPDLSKNPTSTKQLLNCVRVLTRTLPFAYEVCSDGETLEEILLWTPRPRLGTGTDYILGKQLVSAVIDLLFTSGFTIPQATVGENTAVRYTIWENGIGQNGSLGSSKDHIGNRIEVLRLLLTFFSKTMYLSPAQAILLPNTALHAVAYNTNKKMVLCLLCSLVNTALKGHSQGWSLPYRSNNVPDPSELLSLYSIQALFILLDYQTPEPKASGATTSLAQKQDTAEPQYSSSPKSTSTSFEEDVSTPTDTVPNMVLITTTETGSHNLFRVFISKLHRNQEFDYLISNILRLLEDAMSSNLSILASVTRQPARRTMAQEAVILLWMLLENNKQFKDYIVDHNSALRLFSILLYFTLNGYNDPSQVGMVRTILHILHFLSEDSHFATRLMQPFDQSILPSAMRLPDTALTHADFMINVSFTLLSASKPYLVPVYSNLFLLVRNVSPYLTQMCSSTADKLMTLFDIVSSPAYIISEPYHIRWLIYLVEVFDYVVHYRAADNPYLMYSMIQSRSCFTRLKGFDLASAEKELSALREKKGKVEAVRIIGSMDPSQRLTTSTGGSRESTTQVEHTDTENNGTASPTLSDRARGKLPDTSSIKGNVSTNSTGGELKVKPENPTNTGSNDTKARQFQPTAEWVFSWLPDLPLDPIISVLEALACKTDQIAHEVQADFAALGNPALDAKHTMESSETETNAAQVEEQQSTVVMDISPDPKSTIIQWLSSDAMAKSLPDLNESMPQIRPRLQGLSPALVVWFRSHLWSLVYASGMKPFGVWRNTNVRLFVVKNHL